MAGAMSHKIVTPAGGSSASRPRLRVAKIQSAFTLGANLRVGLIGYANFPARFEG
ncbi:MAG: hypothetical protein QOD12_2688 [Verrucomicrobiota bacterium]|jgi:hypothetical protein